MVSIDFAVYQLVMLSNDLAVYQLVMLSNDFAVYQLAMLFNDFAVYGLRCHPMISQFTIHGIINMQYARWQVGYALA